MQRFVASQWKTLTNVEMEKISELCVISLQRPVHYEYVSCSDRQWEAKLTFITSPTVCVAFRPCID